MGIFPLYRYALTTFSDFSDVGIFGFWSSLSEYSQFLYLHYSQFNISSPPLCCAFIF